MPLHEKMLQTLQFEGMAVPIDTTGAAVASDWIGLKGAARMVILIQQGAWAGGTPALTLKQSKTFDNSDSSSKALSFAEKFSKVAITGAKWVRATVSSDTFTLPAVANTLTAIEVTAEMLDRDNGFGYVQCAIATPGANADLICVMAVLDGLRHQGDPVAILEDPKV